MIMTHLCTKRFIPLGGLLTLVSSLWLCLPAKAIDPARLHMKPFGHPASLNQILAPTLRSPVQQQQQEEEPLIELFATGPQWHPLGTSPIPNGQTFGPTEVPVSGRVSAIAVDPHDPNLVYVGGAQGGVYRSSDGGQNWTQLLVGAKNFAIGCITVDPVDHNIIFIGTGEGNLSADSYFGVGVYVVRNAKLGTPKLEGPFNLDETGTNLFTYRSIDSIVVDRKNDNIVFCASSCGAGGLGAKVGYPSTAVPLRGLYRSRNFLTGTHRFQRLNVGPGTNTIVTSAVLDPANPSHLVCAVFGQVSGTSTDQNPQGGIYYTDDALAANPTFTRTQQTLPKTSDGNVPLFTNIKLAAADVNGKLTVLAATDEFDTSQLDQGLLRKSTDGGKTFPAILTAADGFAGGQGFYNIAIAIDQKNPQNVYLAGTLSATGVDPDGPPGYGYMYIDGQVVPNHKPSNPTASGHGPANGGGTFQYSTDGGQTFTPSVSGLHADSHAIAIAPSATNVIYTGNDGGIWASADSGKEWRDCNTERFSATQFESVAVHPTDPNFTLGGTQDNGTILRIPDGSFY